MPIRSATALCALATIVVSASTVARGADLICSTPTSIAVPTAYDNVTVQSGCVLTVDAALTVANNMTVQSGGIVTHALRLQAGLVLNVTGTLDVQTGGLIDVNARGLRGGGSSGSSFGNNGEVYDAAGTIVSGPAGGGSGVTGASHGGRGGEPATLTANAPYGRVEDALFLGSGASSFGPGSNGGNGGGRVTITAGTLNVAGTIRADGANATSFGGGGSGGSLRITAGTLSGSGQIRARGGNASPTSNLYGGGAGGRVAVYYATKSFPDGGFDLRGGGTGSNPFGAAGTVYLKDAAVSDGDLIVDNEGVTTAEESPLLTALTTFRAVTVLGAGRLAVPGGLALGQVALTGGTLVATGNVSIPTGSDLSMTSSAALVVSSGTILTLGSFDATNVQSGQVQIVAGGRLDVTSGSVTIGTGVTLIKDGTFGPSDQITTMTVQSGGVVTHTLRLQAGLVLGVTGTLDVQAGGLIDVNAKGLRGGGTSGSSFGNNGEVYDAGGGIVSGPVGTGIGVPGASHGGGGAEPGGVTANAPYGRVEDAIQLGSGGSSIGPASNGGSGGGRVTITAGTLSVAGTIRADGADATSFGGGGSGGSIRITAGTLSGVGLIRARGGNPHTLSTGYGGGGGGRVAVYYTVKSFPNTGFDLRGGGIAPSGLGTAGTLFLKDAGAGAGDLIVDNESVAAAGNTPLLTALTTFRSVTLAAAGRLSVPGGIALGQVALTGGTLVATGNVSIPTGSDLAITSAGALVVSSGSTMTLGSLDASNVQSGQVHVAAGGRLDVTSGSVTVGAGVTLVKDGVFGPSDQIATLTVLSGGSVTHSVRLEAGLTLDVTGTLDVQASGLIDVNARGLRGGGTSGSSFGNNGEVFNTGGTIVAGPAGSGSGVTGASHGGRGGEPATLTANAPYGRVEDAEFLGSGGSSVGPGSNGGNGGGRITITAGTLSVAGTIRADGADATSFGGGGSGGSIRITAGTISGAGQIRARGGNPHTLSTVYGGGSGGRVAVNYTTKTFPNTGFDLRGGGVVPAMLGSAGTLYVKDASLAAGDLIVDNEGVASVEDTPLLTALTTFRSVSVLGLGRLTVPGGIALGQVTLLSGTLTTTGNVTIPAGSDLSVTSSGSLVVSSGTTMTLGSFDATNVQSGQVHVAAGGRLDVTTGSVTIGSSVTLVKDGVFGPSDQIATLTVQSGGSVTHSLRLEAGLILNVTGALDVQIGGLIDVNAKGLRGGGGNGSSFGNSGEVYDAAGTIVAGSAGAGGAAAGASQGGRGGEPGVLIANAPYGRVEDALYVGSGGSCSGIGTSGGHGGGRLTITVGTLSVAGTIRADGGDAPLAGGSGGSGGSIRITASTLSGAGVIRARGGNTAPAAAPSGGGGGGRVAVYYTTKTFPNTGFDLRGGGTGTAPPGASGTLYLKDAVLTDGDLILDNESVVSVEATPLATLLSNFRDVAIVNRGRLEVDPNSTPALTSSSLTLDGTSSLIVPSRSIPPLRWSVAGLLSLANAATINLDATGLRGGGVPGNPFDNFGETFSGATQNVISGATFGSGGSYGGLGGGATPGVTNDIMQDPRHAGSGGSRSQASGAGGSGGGRLWIDAATCSLAAGTTISVNGAAATSGTGTQGGGSGGGIKLDCATITGGGNLQSKGGPGTGTGGNGGGGGRIALRTNINTWTGAHDESGGSGSFVAGGAGSFFLGDLVPPNVTSMTPTPGSTYVGDLSQIVVKLSENLWAPSVSASFIQLVGAVNGAFSPSNVAFDTGTQDLTISFPGPLPQDTYTLTLVSSEQPAGLCDTSINALDGECPGGTCDSGAELPSGSGGSGGNFVAVFTLNPPPRVVEVSPVANSLGVPEASNVSVSFSEAVAPGSLTASTLQLLAGGAPVSAGVTLATSGTRATLDPVAALPLNTLFAVNVTSGVTDLTAQAAVPFTSGFRTSTTATGSRTLPSVSDTSDSLGALSRTGAAVAAAGDLDADGIKDWLVGAPSRQASGGPVEAGGVGVYLGSADAAQRRAPDIIFTGVGAHDRAGVSVSGAFDYNLDGKPDILIGAEQFNRTPDNDPGAGCNAGAPCGAGKVYLIFFRASDYPNLGDPDVPDTIDLGRVANGLGNEIPGVVFTGISLGDQAGFAVAGGGQAIPSGKPFVLIGAPGSTVPDTVPRIQAGTAYVIYQSSTLAGTVSLSRVANGLGDQVAGAVYKGAAAGDHFGFSVAVLGNVVTPTTILLDTVTGSSAGVGAPGASSGSGSGTVIVVKETDTTEIETDSIGLTRPGFRIIGVQDDEQLGWTIADGGEHLVDGVSSVLVGAPTYDADIRTDAGRVLETSQVVPSGVYSASAIGTTLAGVAWTGAATGDHLGEAAAGVEDVNADGYDDVVLGAPFYDPVIGGNTQTDAGTVYLISGTDAPAFGGTVGVENVGTTVEGERLDGTQPAEHAGASIAGTGDIDGNGDNDFIVGAPEFDTQTDTDAGTVYLVTETEPDPPGTCGTGGCSVADLATGAQLTVPSGSLASAVAIVIEGLVDPVKLPGPAPAGTTLLAAARLAPFGQTFVPPLPTASLPTRASLESQVSLGEAFDAYVWDPTGSAWVDSTRDFQIAVNPQITGRKAATGTIDVLKTYAVFLPDLDGDQVRDSLDNCPSVANAPQTNADGDAFGDACDTCTDTDGDGFGNPGFPGNTCPLDNCPSASNPTQTDQDGDLVGNACDNCVSVANASQSDSDNDGLGDACDTDLLLRVSSRVSDLADFGTIQAAVNAATQSGTRIRILPGLNGTYAESVLVNRSMAFTFEYQDDGSHVPVVVDGGGSPAFQIQSTLGTSPMSFRKLTLRGSNGIQTQVAVVLPTLIEDCTFDGSSGSALALNNGAHIIARATITSGAAGGVTLGTGGTLTLTDSSINGTTGTGLSLNGATTATTVVVSGGGGAGVVLQGSGSLTLRHATIAGNAGVGIDNTAARPVTVAHAIVHGNALGDLVGVACASVTWSDTGSVDCTATGNVQVSPLFVGAGDWRLQAASPLLDFGPSPASYGGNPCRDLDTTPRLKDHDGDGLARIDPGAYERRNTALVPGNVANARFTSKTVLTWDATASAGEYHVYRDQISNLGYGNFGLCRDDLDGTRTDTQLTDTSTPPLGQGFAYVIAADSLAGPGGSAGTMGECKCMERSNFTPCP